MESSEQLYPLRNTGVFVEALSRGFFNTLVLQQLSLVAAPGEIYVLLGSSSSGKTSLVRTLTGELIPEQGKVRIAGVNPVEGVGPLLGLMTQESGLFTDLSVMENCVYFGRLNRMSPEEVEVVYEELQHLLDLADKDAVVGNLSRGAQQMISFYIAIQHNPQVIILDEPNVGLDVLRNKRIWDLLRYRAHEEGCTVLVSSHNVDDTRHADRVGFLRAGRLLAEGTAESLCTQYNCRSLEAVFTSLCLQDDQSFLPIVRKMNQKSAASTVNQDDDDFRHFEAVSESSSSDGERPDREADPGTLSSELRPFLSKPIGARSLFSDRARNEWRGWRHLPAVLARHVHSLRRSWLLLLFQIAIPTLLALMFLVFVGHTPQMLNVAVVNKDGGELGAELARLVNVSDLLETYFFDSYDAARASITASNGMLAIFVIPENFTSSLYELMSHPAQFAANFTNVELWLDYGDYVVTQVVEDKLEKSLQQLLSEYFGTSMRLYNTRQIYGDSGTQYVRYIAAGYLAYTAFCFAMFVTVLTFFWERRHGCLRRGFSMGLRPWVLVFSHMLIYSLICVIQSSVMLIATLSFFDLQVYGNYGLLLVMLWLVAIAGLSTGLLVSGLSSSEVTAIQVSVALSFLLLSLGGILWPLASVSTSISWISDLLPVTWAASGIRDIYTRNWGLEQRAIMLALVVPIAWTIISIFILMIFVLRPSTRLWTTFTCCRKRGLTN